MTRVFLLLEVTGPCVKKEPKSLFFALYVSIKSLDYLCLIGVYKFTKFTM
uniref:BIN2 n=1 Tax=Arundo donax TaxID=35708 RepID=A0A0A9G573_ARUDO